MGYSDVSISFPAFQLRTAYAFAVARSVTCRTRETKPVSLHSSGHLHGIFIRLLFVEWTPSPLTVFSPTPFFATAISRTSYVEAEINGGNDEEEILVFFFLFFFILSV